MEIEMSSSATVLLDVDLQPGRPPMLRADAAGDGPSWAAVHRDGLRAVVAEHGAVLVRGLGLRDAAEVAAVFRGLATAGLMTEQRGVRASGRPTPRACTPRRSGRRTSRCACTTS